MAPETTKAAKTKFILLSKTANPPNMAAIKPAAGPLIAKLLPLKNVVTIPAIIAESKPDIGVTPDATAIPNAKGRATNATLIAAVRSLLQFSFSPLKPVEGIGLFTFID